MFHSSKQVVTLRRIAVSFFMLTLLLSQLTNWTPVQAASPETIAAWNFTNINESATKVTENGVIRYKATSGTQQHSSSTAPRNFKVQISGDMQSWTNVSGSSLVLTNSFNCSNDNQGNVLNPIGTVYLMGNTAAAKFYEIDTRVNDYFSQVNAQPNKKMFVDISVTNDMLTLTSYTAAKGEALAQYDKYSIKRTDTPPNKVQNTSATISGTTATLTWNAPAAGGETTRGYRVYEADNKIGTNWSAYIPANSGQSAYSYTLNGVSSSTSYTFVIKAVGVRNNSQATDVTAGSGSSSSSITLPVVSDSYVRGGTHSNTNFSTETSMTVKKNDSNPSSVRQGYLKFDKSLVSGPTTSAKIRLYVESIHSDATSGAAY